MRLKDKVCLITGAAGGIGLTASRLFAEEGATVIMADLESDALNRLAKEIDNPRVTATTLDVSDPEQTAEVIQSVVDQFGRLDVLLANAGIEGPVKSIEECPVEAFDKVMAVNVRGVWLGIKHAMPVMRRQGKGSIVITSSGAALQGMPNMSCYNTSKHAVTGIMRCAAKEGAADGVRVNTVNPGPIETRMIESIEAGFGSGVRDAFTAGVPMGRYGSPAEVANLMLFLASDDSSFCTGGIYTVDGGNAA